MSIKYKGKTISGGGGSGEEIYPTAETRIGTWIDGKPIYRKTMYYPSFGPSSSSPVSNRIPLPDYNGIDNLINYECFYSPSNDPDKKTFMSLAVVYPDNQIYFAQTWTSNNVLAHNLYFTAEYTKIADKATIKIPYMEDTPKSTEELFEPKTESIGSTASIDW